MKHCFPLAILLVLVTLAACVTDGPVRLDPIPLTTEEIDFLRKLEDPETFSQVQEVPALFQGLSSLHDAWLEAYLSKDSPKNIRIYTNLGGALTRRVYANYETILDQFHNGPQPNRVIAAAALGFSRIPESPRFPPVHQSAVDALLASLDCGDDAIVKNALLSLYNLEDQNMPLEKVLDIMVRHHDPDVRSNAALAVLTTVTKEKTDLVLPYVLPGLKDDDPKVRTHCVLIAIKLKDRSTITSLLELLHDPYHLIQAAAVRALGHMDDLSLCGSLIPLLDSRKEIVREYTWLSLKQLSGEDFGHDQDRWARWWNDLRED